MPSFLRRGKEGAGTVVKHGASKVLIQPTVQAAAPAGPPPARTPQPRPPAGDGSRVWTNPTLNSRGSSGAAHATLAAASTTGDASLVSFDDAPPAAAVSPPGRGGRYCPPPMPSEIRQPALEPERRHFGGSGGVEAVEHAPVRVLAKAPLSSRLVGPIRSSGRPLGPTGRLFLRVPLHPGQMARDVTIELGDFAVSIVLTEIDGGVVEAARRKVARDVVSFQAGSRGRVLVTVWMFWSWILFDGYFGVLYKGWRSR